MTSHPFRGYTIVESQKSGNIINKIENYSGEKKPVGFVFSGIGSQWLGMGKLHLVFNIRM